MAAGSALWLFPLLPAVTAAGARPQFGWSPMTGLAITVAGLGLLAIGQRAAKS